MSKQIFYKRHEVEEGTYVVTRVDGFDHPNGEGSRFEVGSTFTLDDVEYATKNSITRVRFNDETAPDPKSLFETKWTREATEREPS